MTNAEIAAIAQAVAQAVAQTLATMSPAASPAAVGAAPAAPAVVVPAPAPAPAVIAPAPLPYHGVGGFMVMDRVAPNTPGTVTLPQTRNTLALPMTNTAKLTEGESLMSYIGRVCSQCGVPPDQEDMAIANTAQLINGFESLLARAGIDRMNPWSLGSQAKWPLAADIYYNRAAYMTDAERAQEAAAQAAADLPCSPRPEPTPP